MTTDRRTKAQKIAAIAATANYNENEAAVAATKLAEHEARVGESEARLSAIAVEIKDEWNKGIDTQFAIGHKLAEAFALLNGDKKRYGAWLREQSLPFASTTAWLLREGAENEAQIRDVISAYALIDREIGVTRAVRLVQEERNGSALVIDVGPTGDNFTRALTALHDAADAVYGMLNVFPIEATAEDAERSLRTGKIVKVLYERQLVLAKGDI